MQVELLETNMQTEITDLTANLREAWATNSNLRIRTVTFLQLAEKKLLAEDPYRQYRWGVSVNDEVLIHNGPYYARFKVRDLLIYKVVTLFSS